MRAVRHVAIRCWWRRWRGRDGGQGCAAPAKPACAKRMSLTRVSSSRRKCCRRRTRHGFGLIKPERAQLRDPWSEPDCMTRYNSSIPRRSLSGTRRGVAFPSRRSRKPFSPSSSKRPRYRRNCRSDVPNSSEASNADNSDASQRLSTSRNFNILSSCSHAVRFIRDPPGSRSKPDNSRATEPDNSCAYDS